MVAVNVSLVRQILTCSHEHNSKRELLRQPYLHLAPHYRKYTERAVSDTVLRRYYRQHGYSHRNYRRTQTHKEPTQGCGKYSNRTYKNGQRANRKQTTVGHNYGAHNRSNCSTIPGQLSTQTKASLSLTLRKMYNHLSHTTICNNTAGIY